MPKSSRGPKTHHAEKRKYQKSLTPDRQFAFYKALADDFPFFLNQLWGAIGLPPPAVHQVDMAHWIANGPKRRGVRAWRGASKTMIMIAYSLWRLHRNPEEKILFVSHASTHSQQSLFLARQWIEIVPWLRHMRPGKERRDSAIRFDVGTCRSHHDRVASWTANGITGMITGSRATLICGDDVETEETCSTLGQREKLVEAVKELDRIVKPVGADIVYLGTPFHEQESLYDDLPKRGYEFRAWPVQFPGENEKVPYLSPLVEDMIQGISYPDLMSKYPYLKWSNQKSLAQFLQAA